MADDGFTPQVEWILRHCTGRTQTMLFSATLDGDVGHLIRHYLNDPIEVAIDSATDTVGTMHHLFLAVHHMDKDRVVGADRARASPRCSCSARPSGCATGSTGSLEDLGVSVAAIHGDLPQPSRERAMRRFAEGKLAVLVATDVAARGIDIDDIGAVIHYEPAEGRQGLPAPLRPHGTRRPRRLGDHVRRVQPAHPDAHPAARAAPADDAADRGVQQQPEPARPHPLRSRRQDLTGTGAPTRSGWPILAAAARMATQKLAARAVRS